MFRLLGAVIIAILLTACNYNAGTTGQKLDSLGDKIDSFGDKIDTTLEKAWDSTKVRARDLKEKIENKFDKKKDSVITKDTLKN